MLKYGTKVWRVNKLLDANNKLNCGWIMSNSTKGRKGVNFTRRESGKRYIHSEVVQLTNTVATI